MSGNLDKNLPQPTAETAAYWEGCRKHQLLIQQCTQCGHYQFYPRILLRMAEVVLVVFEVFLDQRRIAFDEEYVFGVLFLGGSGEVVGAGDDRLLIDQI